jgi:hypothetical protein
MIGEAVEWCVICRAAVKKWRLSTPCPVIALAATDQPPVLHSACATEETINHFPHNVLQLPNCISVLRCCRICIGMGNTQKKRTAHHSSGEFRFFLPIRASWFAGPKKSRRAGRLGHTLPAPLNHGLSTQMSSSSQ